MHIRTISVNDNPKLTAFWKENYALYDMDNFEQFKLFLEKNPDLSIVMEDKGEIIGTALGSYDGRRGYIQKIVTNKKLRKQGIGKQLVEEVLKRLKKVGAVYIPISVEEDLVPFYESCGFHKKASISMSIEL